MPVILGTPPYRIQGASQLELTSSRSGCISTPMFGMSGEHFLLLGIVLLIFGPRRLPELGNTLGKAIKNFKDSVSGVEEANFRKLEETEKKAEAIAQAAPSVAEATPVSHPPL